MLTPSLLKFAAMNVCKREKKGDIQAYMKQIGAIEGDNPFMEGALGPITNKSEHTKEKHS
ncbi:hypothetical protein ACS0TY_014893 [Phlomoides rotata]